jgi:hypothetical protein
MIVSSFQGTMNSWVKDLKESEHGQWMTLKNGISMYVKKVQQKDHTVSFRIIVNDHDTASRNESMQESAALTIYLAPEDKMVEEKSLSNVVSCDLSFKAGNEWDQFVYAFMQKFQELKEKNLIPQGLVIVGNFPEPDVISWFDKFFEDERFLTSLEENPMKGISPVLVEISYSCSKDFNSKGDFQSMWVQNLLHSLFAKRLESSSSAPKIALKMKPSSAVLPFQKCTFYATTSETEFLNALNILVDELEKVKFEGFSKEEFAACKEEWQEKLFRLASSLSCFDNSTLADYFAYQMQNQKDRLSFSSLLQMSWDILDSVGFEEFSHYLSFFLKENNRHIRIHSLPDKEEEKVQEPIQTSFDPHHHSQLPVLFATNRLRSEESSRDLVLQLNDANTTSKTGENPFFQLPITDEEKKIIEYIITTMAEKNVIKLALMRKTMEKKGKRIHHVHPFRFLEHVFSNPKLKSAMHKIYKSGFKWDGFLDGFSKKMKEEANKNNLLPYVPGLSKSLNVSSDSISNFIYRRDYEGLVKFLMHS